MRAPVRSDLIVGSLPVGYVEIGDSVDDRTLCEAALVPEVQKIDGKWVVVGWLLIPRINVDTRHVELM